MTDWDQRQLCPDGSCTGLIGSDGLCKVCGHAAPNWGDERTRGLATGDDDADEEDDEDDEDDDGELDGDELAADSGDDDDDDDDEDEAEDEKDNVDDDAAYEWSRRKLCPDEACVGVLGPNNKCKVCGKGPG